MESFSSGNLEFYLYEDTVAKQLATHDYVIPGDAEAPAYDNVIVEPLRLIKDSEVKEYEGGVCTRDFEFIAGQQRAWDKHHTIRSCESSYACDLENIARIDEEVVFGGILCNQFGHMIMDTASRLWYTIAHKECTARVVFVTIPASPTFFVKDDMHFRFLQMCGIDPDRVLLVWEPTMFKRVIVPDETIFLEGRGAYRKEALITYNKLRESARPSKHKKIYLTRSKYTDLNPTIGEEAFEAFFASRGYEVISPELLDFEEQVALFAGATHIAGTTGSVTHLACCARDDAQCCFLNRSSVPVPGHVMISHMRGIEASYVDVHLNFLPEDHIHGVLLLGETPCWKLFMAEHPQLAAEGDSLQNRVDELVPQYVRTWGREINKPLMYTYVSGEDVAHIAYRTNRFFLHDTTDLDFRKPAHAPKQGEDEAETALPSSAPQRCCMVSIEATGDTSCVFAGTIELPLVSAIDEVCLTISPNEETGVSPDIVLPPAEYSFDANRHQLCWKQELDFADLYEACPSIATNEPQALMLRLRAGEATYAMHLVTDGDLPHFSVINSSCMRLVPRILVNDENRTLGICLQDLGAFFQSSFVHRVERVERRGPVVRMCGWADFPRDAMPHNLVMLLQDTTGSSCMQVPVRLDSDVDPSSFTVEIDCAEVASALPNSKLELFLQAEWDGIQAKVPFGSHCSDEALTQLKQASMDCGQSMVAFHQNGEGCLFVHVTDISRLLNGLAGQKSGIKLHTAAWTDEGLHITGTLRTSLVSGSDFALGLLLINNHEEQTLITPVLTSIQWNKGYFASFECKVGYADIIRNCTQAQWTRRRVYLVVTCGNERRRIRLRKDLFSLSIWQRVCYKLGQGSPRYKGIQCCMEANEEDKLSLETHVVSIVRRMRQKVERRFAKKDL